jgi:hypothetical protein
MSSNGVPMGLKTPRSARTPACRVHTHVNAWDSVAVGPASSTEWWNFHHATLVVSRERFSC